MQQINVVNGPQNASRIILGCMRMPALSVYESADMIRAAAEEGINFFDHATCYGDGEAETRFGDAFPLTGLKREEVYLQSKCGLHFDRKEFDWSREDIMASAEASLKRLKTDYLDVLLLHRPDALMEPDEVAEAFVKLKEEGKVRHFGVSNHNPMQMQLLMKSLPMPLAADQLQFSITNSTMITAGVNVNMLNDAAVDRDGGVLDFCRLNDITIQPWSPFWHGLREGVYVDNPLFPELNEKLKEVAEKYAITPTGVVIAWMLRHPAHMQPVAGSMNPQRMKEILAGANVRITREEWYGIYKSAGFKLP